MMLVWLEADMLIREKTGGRRSLDDFCRRFFRGPERVPSVRPYTRSDLIKALVAVTPMDWNAFLASRVDTLRPHAPLDGLRSSGWTLTYGDETNDFMVALESTSAMNDLSLSLGILTKPDGTVADVVAGSPAFAAGLAPAMRILSIDGRKWTIDEARHAVVQAEHGTQALQLVVAAGDVVRAYNVNYHGGLRYPHLTRDGSKPDVLSRILTPRTTDGG
jgi:predicted metalloprotease with PDZ domain